MAPAGVGATGSTGLTVVGEGVGLDTADQAVPSQTSVSV
jgi:hypothetical protein